MLKKTLPIFALSVLGGGTSSSSSVSAGKPETRFLKEILVGRCYDHPPNGGDPGSCEPLVGGVVAVVESHLDGDITPDSFTSYFDVADFSSPADGALFWIGKRSKPGSVGGSVVSVYDTLGGSLLDGLVFCGVDKRTSCPFKDFNKAVGGWIGGQASFWAGAHSEFAKQVRGDVVAVVDGEDATARSLFLNAALKNLNPSKVSGFRMLVANTHPDLSARSSVVTVNKEVTCDSKHVVKLLKSVTAQGIKDVTCSRLVDYVCEEEDSGMMMSYVLYGTAGDELYGRGQPQEVGSNYGRSGNHSKVGPAVFLALGLLTVGLVSKHRYRSARLGYGTIA